MAYEIHDEFSKLELSRSACKYNYKHFRSLIKPRTKLLTLVKANAYGHGAVEFASILQSIGVDYLAVAYPSEGIELRQAGISLPILVLTAGSDYYKEIIDYDLEPGIPNLNALKKFEKCFKEYNENRVQKGKEPKKAYKIHIKLDTGMHRLGFMPSEIAELTENLCQNVRVESIYSHLAAAEDPKEDDFTRRQAELFFEQAQRIVDAVMKSRANQKDRPLLHLLNSAGIERFPEYQADMVRLGIGIYGFSAIPSVKLKPVARLKCKIIQIKDIDVNDSIGYNRHGFLKPQSQGEHLREEVKKGRLAVVPVGYADGIDRHLSCGKGKFLVNNNLAPTVGNICMDMTMLDVSNIEAKIGDEVVIFGEKPSVCTIAKDLGTISYEILTSIPRRIKRIITD